MNKEQYDKLQPHYKLLEIWHHDRVMTSTSSINFIHYVYQELGNAPVNTMCGACIAPMLDHVYNAMKEYEKINIA